MALQTKERGISVVFQIEKDQFGSFLAQCRKKQGLTQKQLAQRLYISDKAVSKWERGLSLPDISLLQPLARELGVSVTELLEGRPLARQEGREQAERLVGKALSLSRPRGRRAWRESSRRNLLFAALCALALAETGLLLLWADFAYPAWSGLLLYQGLSLFFGCYFWLFILCRLPDYYDTNSISAYYDGPFRMSLLGAALNNRNWPAVCRAGRIWCTASSLAVPPLFAVGLWLVPDFWQLYGSLALLIPYLFSLFGCLYWGTRQA